MRRVLGLCLSTVVLASLLAFVINQSDSTSESDGTEVKVMPEGFVCFPDDFICGQWIAMTSPTSKRSLLFTFRSPNITGFSAADISLGGTATGCSATLDNNPEEIYSARNVFVTCTGPGTVSLTLAQDSISTARGTVGPESDIASQVVEIVNGAVLRIQKPIDGIGGGGGTVESNLSGIRCGTLCSGVFPTGTVITLTAVPDPTQLFAGWSGACSGLQSCSLTLNGDVDVVARFVRGSAIAITKVGTGSGTVTSSIEGLNCGSQCTIRYGGNVTLSARADRGSRFDGWFQPGSYQPSIDTGGCGTSSTCTVTPGTIIFALFSRR